MAQIIDLMGQKFERLTVIEFAGLSKDKKSMWKCQCNCEKKTIKTYKAHSLKIGNAKSCGCIKKPGPIEADQRIREKLIANSIRNGECLEWQGYIPENGVHYGMIYYPKTKKYHSVHRLAYMLFKEQIPDKACILHSCDNNRCIEINHLRIGTKKDNAIDMSTRNRHPYLISNKRSAHHNAKLSEESVLAIRRLRKQGLTLKEISNRFGVHYSTIGYICQNITWEEV